MAKLRIAQIVSSIETQAAGTSYAVVRLSHSLAATDDADVKVLTLGPPGRSTSFGVTFEQVTRDFQWLKPIRRLGVSAALRRILEAEQSDIFHANGLWMMPNIYPAEIARRTARPLVLSPHGMLGAASLNYSRWRKRAFWNLFQKKAIEAVTCFHATADSELEDIRALGLSQPVAVVPNGIDLPPILPRLDERRQEPAYVLALGRIHPIKGLDRLIGAWSLIAKDQPEWKLRIVGPDDGGYAGELKKQVAAASLEGRVSIEGPVYGEEKANLMRDAAIFALPSLYENFGMTVAESLAVETPVIATKGAPWEGLAEHGCGWWIDHGKESMAAALLEAMAVPQAERWAMGARGRAWMQNDFAWKGVARQMIEVYRWLVGKADRPDSVRIV